MDLSIRARSIDIGEELQDAISRRIEFALDAFANRVASVSVYLADVNGPRGGVDDKVCQIAVVLRGVGDVVLRASAPTAPVAFARAAQGLKYRIAEALRNERQRESESIRTTLPAA